MKRIALLFLLAPLAAGAMTHYKDGSIMLTPEEVKNVERNFNEMKETIEQAVEIIEMQEKKIEELAKGGRCI
jgi:chaperonin cofactor prefoldin